MSDDLDDERVRLEHEMEDLEEDESRAKREIEEELEREHWGREPERPLSWEKPPSAPPES
jgi:hypothetical protein